MATIEENILLLFFLFFVSFEVRVFGFFFVSENIKILKELNNIY